MYRQMVILQGFHAGNLLHSISSPWLPGDFGRFSADSDEVMDGLPDGSTD